MTMNHKIVDDLFFELFCEKNSDGTRHLRLHGREMYQRFGRRLNENDMPKLAIFLKQHPEVVSLNLAYNDIGNKGIQVLAEEYLAEENNLNFLNLLHCDIEAEGMKSLSYAKCLRLKSLRLVGNKLGLEGARFIGILIEHCSTLEDLDIGETDQILESIESLLIVIEKSSLKSLNISRIIPSSFYSKYNNSALADDLGILLKMNTSLEVLRVQKCEFDGHDVELLLGGLWAHKNLLMLDLAANKIGDHGMEILADWFKTRPNLIALRVPSNEIGNIGAQALGLNLPFSRIRLLDLQNNRMNKKGLSDIINSIKKTTQIRMLYLWGNDFSPTELDKLNGMINAGVLNQDYIDLKIYYVEGIAQAAHYTTNRFKHRMYSVLDYGYPPELKIIRNELHDPNEKPRAKVNFAFFDRFPPVHKFDAAGAVNKALLENDKKPDDVHSDKSLETKGKNRHLSIASKTIQSNHGSLDTKRESIETLLKQTLEKEYVN